MPINVGGIPGIGRHKGARRQGRRNSNDQHGLARRKSLNHAHSRPKRYVFHPNHKMQGYHVAFERNGQTSCCIIAIPSAFRRLKHDAAMLDNRTR